MIPCSCAATQFPALRSLASIAEGKGEGPAYGRMRLGGGLTSALYLPLEAESMTFVFCNIALRNTCT